jgi:hypothetical protein
MVKIEMLSWCIHSRMQTKHTIRAGITYSRFPGFTFMIKTTRRFFKTEGQIFITENIIMDKRAKWTRIIQVPSIVYYLQQVRRGWRIIKAACRLSLGETTKMSHTFLRKPQQLWWSWSRSFISLLSATAQSQQADCCTHKCKKNHYKEERCIFSYGHGSCLFSSHIHDLILVVL